MNAHLSQLLDKIDEIRQEARALTAGLDDEALSRQPAGGGWSASQCLEHLIVTNDLYYAKMESLQEQLKDGATRTSRSEWRPSFFGRLLIKIVQPTATRKYPNPGIFSPGVRARPNVLDEFLRSQDRLESFVRKAAGLDLRRTKLRSPISRLVPLNLGDVLTILVLHEQRHLGQARRALSMAGARDGG